MAAPKIESKKIGDVWICDYMSTPRPHIKIGIWDQDAETTISIEEAMAIRRFLTEIIIKAKQ